MNYEFIKTLAKPQKLCKNKATEEAKTEREKCIF